MNHQTQYELARLSNDAKSEIKHRLNNPLTIIKGTADLVRMAHAEAARDDLDAKTADKMKVITAAVDRIHDEFNELLGAQL